MVIYLFTEFFFLLRSLKSNLEKFVVTIYFEQHSQPVVRQVNQNANLNTALAQ